MGESEDAKQGLLAIGTRVEVQSSFDQTWASGFRIAAVVEGHYRLLRRSDDSPLPGTFSPDIVRRERRQSTWWI